MKLESSYIKTKEVLKWKGLHLLNFAASACSQKVRIFMQLKGITWQDHQINLAADANYSDWFMGINPRAQVPVLIDEGEVHIESNDIMQYLESKFPSPCLLPNELQETMQEELQTEDDLHMDIRNISYRFMFGNKLMKKKNTIIKKYEDDAKIGEVLNYRHKSKVLNFYKGVSKKGVTNDAIVSSIDKFREKFDQFEHSLSKQSYLLGDSVTLLDISWFIYVHRLSQVGYPFASHYPKINLWYQNLTTQEEFSSNTKNPFPVKVLMMITKIKDNILGTSLQKIVNFKKNKINF